MHLETLRTSCDCNLNWNGEFRGNGCMVLVNILKIVVLP